MKDTVSDVRPAGRKISGKFSDVFFLSFRSSMTAHIDTALNHIGQLEPSWRKADQERSEPHYNPVFVYQHSWVRGWAFFTQKKQRHPKIYPIKGIITGIRCSVRQFSRRKSGFSLPSFRELPDKKADHSPKKVGIQTPEVRRTISKRKRDFSNN